MVPYALRTFGGRAWANETPNKLFGSRKARYDNAMHIEKLTVKTWNTFWPMSKWTSNFTISDTRHR